jgi:hypothetical protein
VEDTWKVANHFRNWVCTELRNLKEHDLLFLQGDYLFVIDSKPRFIVLVNAQGAWSVRLSETNTSSFELEENCPLSLSEQDIQNCILSSARTTITTDAVTLQKLLHGRIKAKIAFLTGKVVLSGDLNAFLKMVTLLKKNGVRPLESSAV